MTERSEPLGTLSEREMLASFLDYVRATLLLKVEGVSDDDARRPMVPSGTSLAGLVRHLAHVERWWFRAVWAGEEVEFPWSDEDPDADFRLAEGETFADVVALYQSECELSKAVMAGAGSLDTMASDKEYPVSLRWVGWHLVEETARHNGHADILREQIDGVVGD